MTVVVNAIGRKVKKTVIEVENVTVRRRRRRRIATAAEIVTVRRKRETVRRTEGRTKKTDEKPCRASSSSSSSEHEQVKKGEEKRNRKEGQDGKDSKDAKQAKEARHAKSWSRSHSRGKDARQGHKGKTSVSPPGHGEKKAHVWNSVAGKKAEKTFKARSSSEESVVPSEVANKSEGKGAGEIAKRNHGKNCDSRSDSASVVEDEKKNDVEECCSSGGEAEGGDCEVAKKDNVKDSESEGSSGGDIAKKTKAKVSGSAGDSESDGRDRNKDAASPGDANGSEGSGKTKC